MAIFHSTTKIISRSKGRSSVAAAAYRSGERLKNQRDGLTHDFRHRKDVLHSEIMLPESAPPEYAKRSVLWNSVEQAEKRSDAQTAREIELALPLELDSAEQVAMLREYVQTNFVDMGICADVAVHSGHRHRKDESEDKNIKPDNPHAHIMLTMRSVTPDGFGKKARDWNSKKHVRQWRENWATICNREFERKGLEVRIDHRSYEERGIDREGTIHLGAEASQMERKGKMTIKGDINREIERDNMEREQTQANERRFYLGQIADLTEIEQTIERYQDKIAELMARDERLHPLDVREGEVLDEQIRQFEQSLEQSVETLRREHGLDPAEIAAKKAEIQRQLEQLPEPQPLKSKVQEQSKSPEHTQERTQERNRERSR